MRKKRIYKIWKNQLKIQHIDLVVFIFILIDFNQILYLL